MADKNPDYEILSLEVTLLHERWQLLGDLFSDQQINGILNDAAGVAFEVIHTALVDLVIMGIVRIAMDKDSRSLTMHHFKEDWPDAKASFELNRIHGELKPIAAPLEAHRNKRIAHHDRLPAENPAMLPGIFRKEIDDSLALLRDFMNTAAISLGLTPVYYQKVLGRGDGKCLVQAVVDGCELLELRHRVWTELPDGILNQLRYYRLAKQ